MLIRSSLTNEILNPVAIYDKELPSDPSFTVQAFELCTMCGARFGIGYHGLCTGDQRDAIQTEEWPRRLTEILAKDHRQERAHKPFIELDL